MLDDYQTKKMDKHQIKNKRGSKGNKNEKRTKAWLKIKIEKEKKNREVIK